MNAPDPRRWPHPPAAGATTAPALHQIALAALAAGLPPDAHGAEADWLLAQAAAAGLGAGGDIVAARRRRAAPMAA